MSKISKITDFIFTKKVAKKVLAYSLLILLIYLFSDFAFIFFMIFLFAYLFFSLAKNMKNKIDFIIDKISSKYNISFLKKIISVHFLIIFLYILFVLLFILILSSILPQLISELRDIAQNMPVFKEQIDQFNQTLQEIKDGYYEIWWTLNNIMWTKDYELALSVFDKVKNIWIIFLQVIMALVLSLVFLLDRKRLNKYLLGVKESNFKFFYIEYEIIFEKIVKSFWLIFKVQSMIAFVNAILTIVWLYLIWRFYGIIFPYVLTLWLIVFILWFVPVLWVFISSLPIIFVAYHFIWWIEVVIAVIMLIFIVHMIETYYLNPKIVSSFLDFPVSLTFLILIVSEHVFGFAWLLIWVSFFYFIMWLFKDIDNSITNRKTEKKKK